MKTRAEADLLNLFIAAFEKRKTHPDDLGARATAAEPRPSRQGDRGLIA